MFLVVLILVQKLKCDPAEDVPDRPVLAPLSTQDNCGSFNLSAHVNKYVHYFFMYSAFKIGCMRKQPAFRDTSTGFPAN